MAGGGNSGGLVSFLPIAAALAATVATDGAASPWLVDAMGSEAAAGAIMGAGAGALGGGITAAVTGQNVGQSALMGGIGGATLGYGMAPGAAEVVGGATAAPLAGTNVAGTAAIPTGFAGQTTQAGMLAAQEAGMGLSGAEAGAAFTPSEYASQYAAQDLENGLNAGTGTASTGTASTGTASNGIMKLLSDNRGIAALGGTALLGTLMRQDNKKYGVPSTSSQQYSGPLSKLHYDPNNYTPLTTAQPSPAYQPTYANYVKTPYNAYAAAGGHVVSMAQGGIAGANQNNDGSGQMFQNNAIAQNQIYPQSTISSDAFSSATNTPISQNIVSGVSDTNVDPYTGAEKFAEGGIADTPQAQLQNIPNTLTQNAMNTNNNLTQDLVSRMAARNAMSPVPGQTPPVAPMQPAGIMAAAPQTQYQGYSAPTFTRPTVAPIEFQNPGAIVGTKAYNDEQARLAAEEAARQAAIPSYNPFSTDSSPGGGDGGGGGGEAAGGLMRSYAAGGHLGSYSDGGRMLKGPGDGMSDNIPATIGGKQPARLADGEFVVPADVVSHLGNGSTDAGAKHLYAMMDKVRKARTGNKKQGKQIKAAKYLKA